MTDPCYIDSEWRRANKKPGSFGFEGIRAALLAEPSDGGQPENTAQVCFKSGHEGAAVAVMRFGGDGTYPVEAKILENGQIAAIRVVFLRA